MRRALRLVNTDPERRCYNGCLYSSEIIWSDWETHETVHKESADKRLKFCRELNDYVVSQKGESAKGEYKILEIER